MPAILWPNLQIQLSSLLTAHENLLGSWGWRAVDTEAFTFAAGGMGLKNELAESEPAKDREVFK